MKKALLVTTVSGFVPQFEMGNVRILQEMGYEVHYAANYHMPSYGDDNSRLEGTGIIRHQVDFERSPYSRKNLAAYRQLKELMVRERFQLVHCHTPMGGALARLAAHATHTGPVVYTAHGFHFFQGAPVLNWLIYYPIERWLSRYTDVQVTINHEDYVRAKGFHAKRTARIHGVGIELKRPEPIDRETKRAKLGVKPDEILLITAGELNKNKNQQMVLETLGILKNRTSRPFVYMVCGKGECLSLLREKAEKLGLQSCVRFLGYREDLREILGAADVFLMPSYREGLPTVVMEAMGAGLPVIGTDIRGNRDLISPGETGYLVKVNDGETMAEDLKLLLEQDDLRETMGKRAREAIRPFGRKQVEKEMRAIYSSLEGQT